MPAFTDGEKIAPAQNAFIVVPSDSSNLAYVTRGVYLGSAGNMKVTFEYGDTVTFSGLLAGIVYPFCVEKVFSTGTTVSGIIGLY